MQVRRYKRDSVRYNMVHGVILLTTRRLYGFLQTYVNKLSKSWGTGSQYTLDVAWLFPLALQVNPPYYVKLVELVPHPETAATVVETTHALMTKVKNKSNKSLNK